MNTTEHEWNPRPAPLCPASGPNWFWPIRLRRDYAVDHTADLELTFDRVNIDKDASAATWKPDVLVGLLVCVQKSYENQRKSKKIKWKSQENQRNLMKIIWKTLKSKENHNKIYEIHRETLQITWKSYENHIKSYENQLKIKKRM